MTPRQVELVQETFRQILPNAVHVADTFYGRLFTLDPTIRPLFRSDMETQGKKVMATLALVTHNLDRPEQFRRAMRHLGQRHVGYGVQPEDYRVVREALLWAMAQELDASFTPEVEEAWTAAFDLLATMMKEAAAAVSKHSGL